VNRKYSIGLDYGTNSVRALLVDISNGEEIASPVWGYEHGTLGVILSRDPNLARQHPADYVKGAEVTIKRALGLARKKIPGFRSNQIVGIGVDTTGSTTLPIDDQGQPLAFRKKFSQHPAAMAWLWKDHTGIREATEITALARKIRPHYVAKCGGTYSSEWYWSKVLKCRREAPEVFDATYSWIELADFIPATLTGTLAPEVFTAGICAAGHKAMYSESWGGFPDRNF
jgi:L-ribulokinase